MTLDDIRHTLMGALTDIAPEIDAEAINPARPLRKQVDLDLADWLNFLVAVHQGLGVEISDAEAARLTTFDQLVAHCAERLGVG